MYSVFIADDEPAVCRLLEHLIDWDNLHMELVGTASNGIQTLDAICSLQPDIVITDIRMPGMDGLELIRRVREAELPVEFVIISGYREFEFARQALKYQVRDYLLKPIREQELNTLLYRLGNMLKLSRRTKSLESVSEQELVRLQSSVRKNWLLRFFEQNDKELTWEEVNQTYHFQWPGGFLLVWEFRILEPDKESSSAVLEAVIRSFRREMETFFPEMEYIIIGNRGCLLAGGEHDTPAQVFAWEQIAREWRKQEEQKRGYPIVLASGPVFEQYKQGRTAERQAHNALCKAIWKGSGYYAAKVNVDLSVFSWNETIEKMLERAFYTMDVSVLEQTLRKLANIQKTKTPDAYLVQLEFLDASMKYLESFLKELSEVESEALRIRDNIWKIGSVHELWALCREFCAKIVEIGIQSRKIQVALPIRMIENYIKENYAQRLCLEDMAELVHMNPNYISSLFKRETGMNFSDYLTKLRMEQAKRLLREAKWNISEIAGQVGYTDVRYFSKSFSKIVGISPREYRRLHS